MEARRRAGGRLRVEAFFEGGPFIRGCCGMQLGEERVWCVLRDEEGQAWQCS